jgi:hypothetical protein
LDNGRGVDTGRLLGSFQPEELKKHNHVVAPSRSADTSIVGGSKIPYFSSAAKEVRTSDYGGNETRPRNVAVTYIIKY